MRGPSALQDLKDRIIAALEGGRPEAGATLQALAKVDPATAAAWLLEGETGAMQELSNAHRRQALATIAEAAAGSLGLLARADIVEILARFGELLPAEGARELAGVARTDGPDDDLREALERALSRVPTAPGLLRAAAELAAAGSDPSRAHGLLTRLGMADSSLPTAQFIADRRRALPAADGTPARIALLSSFTIDPLVPYLDLACRAAQIVPTIEIAPFNMWDREMLGGGSALERFAPQIAFLSVAADDVIPGLAGGMRAAALEEAGRGAVARILEAAARFTEWSPAMLVVHALHTAFTDPLGPASGRSEPGRPEVLDALNARLAQALRALPRAYLLPTGEVLARRRHGAVDNPKMRHLARMRLSEHVLAPLAHTYVQYIAPLVGCTRKCVVLDLDHTLGGGIVGEDGPQGSRLGDTSPGSEYREFQQYLAALAERGILLAINSKNNEEDALEVIRSHEAMVLRESSFSAMRINWDCKPDNMVSLAQELNIGLDSLVFVDDSEKERALMRATLPQVLTVELPRDPAQYRDALERLPELQVLSVTAEDRDRTQQYASRRQRESLRVTAQSLGAYLASLDIQAEVAAASERTLPRVHQLFQRTNQFNLTARRYELGALAERAGQAQWRVYTTQVRDRFGDHGLVATAVVHVTPEAWTVDNLVMSCRVIGYGVEDALLAHLCAEAHGAGARWVLGEHIVTKKNAPARDFYARNAFERQDDANGAERWRREVTTDPPAVPPWIALRHGNDA